LLSIIGGDLSVVRAEVFGKWFLALDLLVVGLVSIQNVQSCALLESIDDGGVWLEALHALERSNDLDVDRLVLGALDLLEQELVLAQIGVAEVELDLLPDLSWIICLLLIIVA
jgi:hypothetical protein